MCSIFGFIAHPGKDIPLSALRKMAEANERRGPHAFGFAWITPDGRLRCYKQAGRITDHLGLLAMTRGARFLVGHVRYATHGHPEHNINNHPHSCDGGWLVHNGVVQNHEELIKERDLYPVSSCDSETLALVIEQHKNKNLLARCAAGVRDTTGNLAFLALWARPATLIAARGGNPLTTTRTDDGRYFSTLLEGLPGARGHSLDDNTATAYNFAHDLKGVPNVTIRQIARRSNTHGAGHPGREGGAYAGG